MQCKCKMARARRLRLYTCTVSPVLRLRGWDGDRGLGSMGADPPQGRYSQEIQGLSLSMTHSVSLDFFPLNLCSFLTNKIKLLYIINRSLEEALFALVERREELVIVLPYLPKLQSKLLGPPEIVAFRRYLRDSSFTPSLHP